MFVPMKVDVDHGKIELVEARDKEHFVARRIAENLLFMWYTPETVQQWLDADSEANRQEAAEEAEARAKAAKLEKDGAKMAVWLAVGHAASGHLEEAVKDAAAAHAILASNSEAALAYAEKCFGWMDEFLAEMEMEG